MTKRRFNFWEEFLKLYRESVIVQSLATVMLLGTVCTMYLVPLFRDGAGGEIPPLLAGLTCMVIRSWFAAKERYRATLDAQKEDA